MSISTAVIDGNGRLAPLVPEESLAVGRLGRVAPSPPTVGREGVRRILLEQRRQGFRLLLLGGPAGVGKTHLARAAMGDMVDVGYQTEEILGGGSTPGVPLGACAHLVPVLAGAVPLAGLIAATIESITRRSVQVPLAVLVDDADMLDDATGTLVAHLCGVVGVVVVATAREPNRLPRSLAAVVRQERVETIEVGPLEPHEVAELSGALAGSTLDPASGLRIYQATGGNPLWVTELMLAAMSRGALRPGAHGLRLDTELAVGGLERVMAQRLGDLSEAELYAVELMAVGGALPILVLETIVGDQVPVALSGAGLVTVGGSPAEPTVRLAHPLHRKCVLAGLDQLRCRSHLRQLVAAAQSTGGSDRAALVRLALWHAALSEHFDPAALGWAAREVHWGLLHVMRRHLAGEATLTCTDDAGLAAGLNTAEDRANAAIRLASGAWKGEPTFDNGLALARSLTFRADQAAEMVAVLDHLRTVAADDEERAWLAVIHAIWLFWTVADRQGAFDETLRVEETLSSPWDRVVASTRAGLAIQGGAIAEGLASLAAARPPESAPPAVHIVNRSPQAAALVISGRLREGLDLCERYLPIAVQLGDESMMAMAELLIIQHWGWICCGQYQQTVTTARALTSLLAHVDDDEGRSLFAGMEARALLFEGRPVTAAAKLADAIRWHGPASMFGFRPLLHTTRALALAWSGRPAEARIEAAEARRWHSAPRFYDAEIDLADAVVLAAEGRRRRAAQVAADAGAGASAQGSWYFAYQAAALAVRLQPTPLHLEVLQQCAVRIDGAPAEVMVQYAEALVNGSAKDLEAAAARASAAGELLVAVEILEAATSRAHEESARTPRVRLEAALARIRSECEGARSPVTSVFSAPPGLTSRESEIAGLAARGWTSTAIADELVLSVRTVESHLYRVFAKLGVRSREELGSALAGQ